MKLKDLKQVKAEVDAIRDGLGKPIDPKVKPLVIGLWRWGIRTDFSCQGHTTHGHSFPWVTIPYSQARRVADLVGRQNRSVLMNGRKNKNIWVLRPGRALFLQPEKIKSLRQLQRDAETFGNFLQKLPKT